MADCVSNLETSPRDGALRPLGPKIEGLTPGFHERALIVNRNYFEFPSEPPVASIHLPNGAERARARVSAAQRTLACEHRSAI
jgi:hypothetical protein